MSFGCQIVKSLLIGNSFVLKESEGAVLTTVRNTITDKLRKRLLEAMQFKVSKVQLARQLEEADDSKDKEQAAFASQIQDVMRQI